MSPRATPGSPSAAEPPARPPQDEALPPLDDALVLALAEGRHSRPHDVLGRHSVVGEGSVIRALRPLASAVTAIGADGRRVELQHLSQGLWQGLDASSDTAYALEARYPDAPAWLSDDPYRFSPSIGELDLHLIGEGRHEQLWQALGAHHRPHEGVAGVSFTVWAPHATAVRVVGDLNGWNGLGHALCRLDATGVWEIFVPGASPGGTYKFELRTAGGEWVQRADPMARYTEVPPHTASVIGDSHYEWGDAEWMSRRARTDPHHGPMSIYELHLGSWRPGLGYREAADSIIEYVGELGFTHVEFMPLAEHPYGPSWGYQVTGYYAPTSRFGHPDELRYLIDRLHQAGLGVIMDWVPAHFPKDEWALARFDGEPLYEHADPRRGEQADWGTLVFDFGQPQVRNFLVANALYWLEEFHIDGLRVDAVASMLYLDYSRTVWLPNEHGGRENLEAIALLQEVNATAYRRNPGTIMIAEESTAFPGVTRPTSGGGLGFGLKWNMGWMHDSLAYLAADPLYRSHRHHDITFSTQYAFTESFLLPISHDEVVHGKGSLLSKMPGDHAQQLATVRAYLAFMWAHPGKQLLFMGQEFGQLSEWSEQHGLDWWILDQPAHRGLHDLVAALNGLYRSHSALWSLDSSPAGFEWLIGDDSHNNVLAFLRHGDSPTDTDAAADSLAVVINFSGIEQRDYRVGLPQTGRWVELLNTDAAEFGGRNGGNLGGVTATATPSHGRPASALLTLPALSAVFLRHDV